MKTFCFISAAVFTLLARPVKSQLPSYDSIVKNEKVVPLQIGFVPPLSSNGRKNAEIYNHVSINALAGQSKGVLGTELSGIYSENFGHMMGFKGTGVVDVVHGSADGFQAAGVMAAIGGNTEGMQAGGVLAINDGNFNGFQAGGILANTGRSLNGMQAGGVFAYTGDSMSGFQAAGVISICKGRVDGMQAAGLVSIARTLRGLQVGLVNITDSIEDGAVTIGLVNIVRKGGIMQAGVMNTEFSNAALFLRSGTPRFYGYVGAGTHFTGGDFRFSTLIGAGTTIKLAGKVSFNPEWMQWMIAPNGNFVYNNQSNHVQQLRAVFSVNLYKLSISAGPTVNLAYSGYLSSSGERGLDLAPQYFYNKNSNGGNTNVRGWWGYTATVSFSIR
ncbi:MAG TPA: hypothetical protein VEC12_02900 [Bacteroidia bacterium]|nr:hypothetical protein [Bacteroidia bacterium]